MYFPEEEIAEARRVNDTLKWTPRFRARLPWDRIMGQGMLYASQAVVGTRRYLHEVKAETRVIESLGRKVRLRILRPAEGPVRGVHLDIHGGGWAVGNARMDDPVNGAIVRGLRLAVVSVDYDLAPRVDLLQIIAECEAAAVWLFDNAEAEFGVSPVTMSGESAGAHLAACTALRLRERRADFHRLKGVVLFYGCYDLAGTPSALNARPDTLVLHGPSMGPGLRKLTPGLSDEERRDPLISPLYADLRGLPPALLLVGTLDPLIDDSTGLARRWQAASGNAELIIVPEAPHAFNRLGTAMARRTNRCAREWLKSKLRRQLAPEAAVA